MYEDVDLLNEDGLECLKGFRGQSPPDEFALFLVQGWVDGVEEAVDAGCSLGYQVRPGFGDVVVLVDVFEALVLKKLHVPGSMCWRDHLTSQSFD